MGKNWLLKKFGAKKLEQKLKAASVGRETSKDLAFMAVSSDIPVPSTD